MRRRANYEVQVEWLTLTKDDGTQVYVKAGDELPDWVPAAEAEEMTRKGLVQRFGVLSHV